MHELILGLVVSVWCKQLQQLGDPHNTNNKARLACRQATALQPTKAVRDEGLARVRLVLALLLASQLVHHLASRRNGRTCQQSHDTSGSGTTVQ
jgi:hypothetical protein